jgi:hypothetical protein
MSAQENVVTIRKAKTIRATIILRENERLKTTSEPKGNDVGYRHDEDNYVLKDQENYLCSLRNILKGEQAK